MEKGLLIKAKQLKEKMGTFLKLYKNIYFSNSLLSAVSLAYREMTSRYGSVSSEKASRYDTISMNGCGSNFLNGIKSFLSTLLDYYLSKTQQEKYH